MQLLSIHRSPARKGTAVLLPALCCAAIPVAAAAAQPSGTNDGAPDQPFYRNGSRVAHKYNGTTLTMLVADSFADSNAWCRDDPNHLYLETDSLNRLRIGGTRVGAMYPDRWNNRDVSWSFVTTPDYSGDTRIGLPRGD
ncbi:cellulose-binding protein, partial [Streptomyces sp. NPDC021608]